jgi:hypothetical protein
METFPDPPVTEKESHDSEELIVQSIVDEIFTIA